MSKSYFSEQTTISARAYYLGQRLDLKSMWQSKRLSMAPAYLKEVGDNGLAILFRYGVAVLFNMPPEEEARELREIEDYIIEAFETPEIEEEDIILDPDQYEHAAANYTYLHAFDQERLQLFADVLAKCTILSYYESQVSGAFDRIDPIARELKSGGPSGRRTRALLAHMGDVLAIQRQMIGHVEIGDKPELLWDHPELERLYLRLEDEYELKERYTTLQEKLDLIYKTAETLHGLLEDRRILHVEWYIVILILFEVVMGLLERFGGL